MAEAFLSQSWYRVAKLRPALGSHVRVHRHRYRDGPWYVLEDTVTGRVHRLTPAAYAVAGRLDGGRTVDEIWLEVARRLDRDALTQDDVINLLAQLHGADLLSADVVPDVAALAERRTRQGRALHRQNLLNPTSFRLPLFDPSRLLAAVLLVAHPFVGPLGILGWAALVVPALVLALQNWRALTENLPDRVLSADGLLSLVLVYPVVKFLHELGHGVVARRYGAPVHESGVLLLVGVPMPYVDVSASAAFPSRWHRAAVASAGMIVETALAAVALYVWLVSEPGIVRAVCFDVMLIGGVSTLLANGNPLLRFDGYYVFCDLIDVPNLGSRANRYIRRLLDTYAFGIEPHRGLLATPGERVLFLVYAPLAFVYRILLTFSIAAFVATTYYVLGIALAIWMAVQTVALPLLKGGWALLRAPEYRRRRGRTWGVALGTVIVAATLLFGLRAPSWTTTTGVVWLPESSQIRAGTSGFLVAFAVQPGSPVRPGDRLAVLEDPQLEAKIASLSGRVRELSFKLGANVVNDRVLAETTRIELEEARKQFDRERDRRNHMVATSPVEGRFVTAKPAQDGPGRFFKEGDLIGYVLPGAASEVRTVVPQDAMDRVRAGHRGVSVATNDAPGWSADSSLIRAVPAGLFELPSAALGLGAGGAVPTDPRDPEGRKSLARVFQFDVALPTSDRAAVYGSRVAVKFRHDPEPVGTQVYRWLRQLFLASFGA